jgi:hypothetical protein
MKRTLAFCMTLIMVVAASAAMATTIFDNFGFGNDYSPDSYLSVSYYPSYPPYGVVYDVDTAMAFTVTGGDFELSTIAVALSIRGGDNEVDIRIMTDAGGIPGTTMEFWHVSGQVPGYPGVFAPVTVSSNIKPILTVGETYWVFVSASGPSNTSLDWHLNTVGYTGLGAQRTMNDGVGNWNALGNFPATMRVTGRLDVVGAEGVLWDGVKALYR